MRRRSSGLVLVAGSVCLLLYGARGGSQGLRDTPLGQSAIDRGLVKRVYGAPDSPETRVRDSIRSLNGQASGSARQEPRAWRAG